MIQSSSFSEIAIIESLGEAETPTGKFLSEYLIGLESNLNTGLEILYQKCDNKSQFIGLLTELLDRAKNKGSYPLLHIECHGSEAGIVLANNELITWLELKPMLTQINIATKCNLMVMVAACHGAWLGEIVHPTDRAPCWGILGPTEEVSSSDLMGTYRNFYTALFTKLDGDAALEALFNSSAREANYFFMSCLGLFRKAYSGYLNQYCTTKAYWNRAKELQKQLKEAAIKKSLQDIVLDFQKTEPDSFIKYQRQFFMCDLYPENQKRFLLDYSEIKKTA